MQALSNSSSRHPPSKDLRVRFRHGLGDCVNFARLLQLYRRRGWNIRVESEPNKSAIWTAADLDFSNCGGGKNHGWGHGHAFNRPLKMPDYSGNKVASNLNLPPLPEIGDVAALWEELCEDQSLDGAALKLISDDARLEAARFLRDLPGPILLLHTHGNTSQNEKNIPDATVLGLCRELLRRSSASIVMLDWDNRVPRLASGRVRYIKDDWGHLDLHQLAALYDRSDLFVGIDSGPYHFAALTDTPALGVFHEHYPTCLALPRPLTLNMVPAKHRELNVPRRRRWNLVEYGGNMPTAEDIARHALRMLEGPRYLKDKRQIAHDVQLQQWVLDWCEGSTALAQLADRNNTFDLVCQYAGQFGRKPTIVETGCIRSFEDWGGAGHSTYLFAALLDRLGGGSLISIDNDPQKMAFAKNAVTDWKCDFTAVVDDSVSALAGLPKCIDVLYLDSVDVGEPGYEEHALREIKAAERKLTGRSIVVFDDTVWNRGWRGKGAMAVPYLLEQGWTVLGAGYQVVLSKKSPADQSSIGLQ